MNTNLTTIKTSNKKSSEFARKKQPFKASNLNGEILFNKDHNKYYYVIIISIVINIIIMIISIIIIIVVVIIIIISSSVVAPEGAVFERDATRTRTDDVAACCYCADARPLRK